MKSTSNSFQVNCDNFLVSPRVAIRAMGAGNFTVSFIFFNIKRKFTFLDINPVLYRAAGWTTQKEILSYRLPEVI